MYPYLTAFAPAAGGGGFEEYEQYTSGTDTISLENVSNSSDATTADTIYKDYEVHSTEIEINPATASMSYLQAQIRNAAANLLYSKGFTKITAAEIASPA